MQRSESRVSKFLFLLFVLTIISVPTYLYLSGDSLQHVTIRVFALFGQDAYQAFKQELDSQLG